MKRLGYIIFAIGGLLLFAFAGQIGRYVGKSGVQSYEAGKMQGLVEKGQELAAVELRKQLPLQVDKLTTLQTVVSAGKMLIYRYEIATKKTEVDIGGFVSEMTEILKNNTCQQKQMRASMNMNAKYKYMYFDTDGLLLADITISSADCV
jgi:3-phosphoglycerate kinase